MRYRPRLATALEFLLYAILTAIMLHATWLTWPDAYIDFSRELYLPWRVSCGDVLYRDLAYYFGPVSVYVNAALFALIGRPSIHALFALNFVFWVATLLALRAILRRIASPLAATLSIVSFILLFSFNRYIFWGDFNYLAPYSHELPRGFLLALLSLLSLDSALRRRSALLALSAGFLLGLSLFTKPEIALAAVASTVVFFLARFPGDAALGDAASSRVLLKPGRPARDGGTGIPPPAFPSVWTFALGLLLALAAVLVPLSFALGSFSRAFRHGLCKLYLDCFAPALTSLPFFKGVMGTDDIPANAFRLLGGTVLAALPFFLARLTLPRLSSRSMRLAATVLLALAAAAIGFFGFSSLNAALPLAPVLFGIVGLGQYVRHRPLKGNGPTPGSSSGFPANPDCAREKTLPLSLAFSVFALLLVSKMFLNARIYHYGFVLALPSFCCAVLFFFRSPCPAPRAAIAGALLLGFATTALRLQGAVLVPGDIHHPVHDGAYHADPVNAHAFNEILAWIRTHTSPGSTLAVFPEGAVLNVLSGRPNPTPYVSLEEQALPRYDEAALLASYSNNPPDTIVLVRKQQDTEFGTGYAKPLMALLASRYTPVYAYATPSPSGPVPYLLVATRIPSAAPPP